MHAALQCTTHILRYVQQSTTIMAHEDVLICYYFVYMVTTLMNFKLHLALMTACWTHKGDRRGVLYFLRTREPGQELSICWSKKSPLSICQEKARTSWIKITIIYRVVLGKALRVVRSLQRLSFTFRPHITIQWAWILVSLLLRLISESKGVDIRSPNQYR